MIVTVVTPPQPIVTWEEARQHLRRDDDDEKGLIEALVASATAWIDGPTGRLGRCLGEQTLQLVDCAFGNDALPYPPVIAVESIKYLDRAGVEQTFPADQWRKLLNGSVSPVSGASWPSTGGQDDAVRVTYHAGYPVVDGKSTVPSPIRQAILLMVGHMFFNREASMDEALTSGSVPALLSPYRVWS